MEKDAAFLEEINYFVTCHLIFPTISHIYVVKRVNLLTVIQLPLPLLEFFGINNINSFRAVTSLRDKLLFGLVTVISASGPLTISK